MCLKFKYLYDDELKYHFNKHRQNSAFIGFIVISMHETLSFIVTCTIASLFVLIHIPRTSYGAIVICPFQGQ
jgi:hypothetical protein